jgi:hypothetical protein
MTCTHGRHEMLFHLVYGENKDILMEFIFAAAQRQYSLTENISISETVRRMVENPELVSLQQYRGMFFLLLNIDMPLKEYVCDTQNRELLAAALNLTNTPETNGKHAYVMTGTKQAEPLKLENFFGTLSTQIVPNWLQNEGLTISDLVNTIREEYVVS